MWLQTSTYSGSLLCNMLLKKLQKYRLMMSSRISTHSANDDDPLHQLSGKGVFWVLVQWIIIVCTMKRDITLHGVIAHRHWFFFVLYHCARSSFTWPVNWKRAKFWPWRKQYRYVERYGMFCLDEPSCRAQGGSSTYVDPIEGWNMYYCY